EIGGAKFDENLAAAEQAVKALATPELKELLDNTGLGNHPEMVRLFVKLSPLVREDQGLSTGGTRGGESKSRADLLYGDTTKEVIKRPKDGEETWPLLDIDSQTYWTCTSRLTGAESGKRLWKC